MAQARALSLQLDRLLGHRDAELVQALLEHPLHVEGVVQRHDRALGEPGGEAALHLFGLVGVAAPGAETLDRLGLLPVAAYDDALGWWKGGSSSMEPSVPTMTARPGVELASEQVSAAARPSAQARWIAAEASAPLG